MKLSTIVPLLLLFAASASAQWEIAATEKLAAPAGLDFVRSTARTDGQTVDIHRVSFDPKQHTFAVMDNPEGAFSLATAAEKRGALAAVNGGYFHADRTPLGLVVRQGKTLHGFERAKLLSGIVSVRDRKVSIQRAVGFKSGGVQEALQAGPFLVENGQPISGLNNTRSAARTVVFTDSVGRAGFLITNRGTLAETATLLATPGVLGSAKISRALNLDGGSSTAMWVRGDPPYHRRELKGVRNYLAIVPAR
ncbi:MAG TPA: phosphodiester glycosidase family protein [Chthoniobacteraceae bacterium]|jgi:uncharacterized protein YigE (DUF2233 family)